LFQQSGLEKYKRNILKDKHSSEFLFLLTMYFFLQLQPHKKYKGFFNEEILENQLLEILSCMAILPGQT